MRDQYGNSIIIADGFSELVAPHEEADPIGALIREAAALGDELMAATVTPEACDVFLDDQCELFSAAININLAIQRIKSRIGETRIERRLAEIASRPIERRTG